MTAQKKYRIIKKPNTFGDFYFPQYESWFTWRFFYKERYGGKVEIFFKSLKDAEEFIEKHKSGILLGNEYELVKEYH